MAKGIERSLNSVLKTIAKLSDVQKRAKSKTTKSYLIRKGKIKLYKEIAKELKKGLKGKPIDKQFIDIAKSMIKEITPKRKIKVSAEEFFEHMNLHDKYAGLLTPHKHDLISKGIKSALQMIGFDMSRDTKDIFKIDEMLGIEGLSYEETIFLIVNYMHMPIEELFYREPIIEKGSGKIDENYFLGNLRDLAGEIRYIKEYHKNRFSQMRDGYFGDNKRGEF